MTGSWLGAEGSSHWPHPHGGTTDPREGHSAGGSVYVLTCLLFQQWRPHSEPILFPLRHWIPKWAMFRPYKRRTLTETSAVTSLESQTTTLAVMGQERSMSASFFQIPNHSSFSSNSGPTRKSQICSPTNHRDAPILVRPPSSVPLCLHHKVFPPPCLPLTPHPHPANVHGSGWLSCKLRTNSLVCAHLGDLNLYLKQGIWTQIEHTHETNTQIRR